jgi:FkbM family methyltransferase
MLTSALVGGQGSVHAFEPTPWTYSLLQKNTQHLKNVTANNKAVSDKQEKISFKDYGPGYGAYNTAHKDGSILKKKPEIIHTETVSLDEYCKSKAIRPTFVKLDAEGYEFTILHGMEYLLKDVRPLITLEVAGGDAWSSNCKQSIEFLMEKGYMPYEMAVNGEVKSHSIKDSYVYDNLLFVPEEKKNTL